LYLSIRASQNIPCEAPFVGSSGGRPTVLISASIFWTVEAFSPYDWNGN
jgi:hypothetical protein